MRANVGSINHRYAKSTIPDVVIENNWDGSAWRGERISAQLVLWSNEAVRQIECEFSDFKSRNGKSLPSSIAQARFVRYVITDEFAEGCGHRKPEDYAASLSPDVLDPLECFDMESQTSRPVWITIDIPADADPGTYISTMNLYAAGKKYCSFLQQLGKGSIAGFPFPQLARRRYLRCIS